MLREKGFNAFVIVGGLAAWRKAGQPLEPVPHDDLVKLPTFQLIWPNTKKLKSSSAWTECAQLNAAPAGVASAYDHAAHSRNEYALRLARPGAAQTRRTLSSAQIWRAWVLTHKAKGKVGRHKNRVETETTMADGTKWKPSCRPWIHPQLSL